MEFFRLHPDEIFGRLEAWAGGTANTTPAHKAAVLAVMAYLFDKCEIFEDAQAVGRHDPAIQASAAGSCATDRRRACFDVLAHPKTVSALWEELNRHDVGLTTTPRRISYDWFLLALDLLYALGTIELESGLVARRIA